MEETQDWASDIRELYEVKGMTLTEIGSLKGRSRQAIHQRLMKMGVQTGRTEIPQSKVDEVTELFTQGTGDGDMLSVSAISKRLGLSFYKVSKILEKQGLKQVMDERKADKRAQVVSDYLSGMNSRNVADKHGICETTVKNYVLASGNKMRPKGKFERTQETRLKQSETMLGKREKKDDIDKG